MQRESPLLPFALPVYLFSIQMNVNEYILSNNHNNLLMSLMSLTQGKNSHVPGQASHCRARPLPFSIPSVSPPPSPGPVSEHQKIAQRSHVATSDSRVILESLRARQWVSISHHVVLESCVLFNFRIPRLIRRVFFRENTSQPGLSPLETSSSSGEK